MDQLIYLKAYKAYQKANYDQCLNLLQDCQDPRKFDLMAQTYFQRKEFQKAYDTYQSLLEGSANKDNDEFASERKENLLTIIVCAQLEEPNTLKLKGKDKLPSVEEIIDQVDVINLKDERANDVKLPADEIVKKRRRNKKRKIRLPKVYDPVAGPDPERWLPRRDRKANAHRQKKKRSRPQNKARTARSAR